MKIKVKKLYQDAIIPQVMRVGDAAVDFYAYKNYIMKPGERIIVETGVAIAIPEGYWGNVRDRSGLAGKHGLHIMAGVIDSNYRGEIQVVIVNLGQETYQIEKGHRICQMIIEKHENIETSEVDELNQTNRGEDKLASSGY